MVVFDHGLLFPSSLEQLIFSPHSAICTAESAIPAISVTDTRPQFISNYIFFSELHVLWISI